MAEENTENTVEIEEVSTPEPSAFATHGLLPEEIEMAEKHGLVAGNTGEKENNQESSEKKVDESSKEKDGKHKESTEPETEDSEEKEEEVKTFEDVEKNEDKLKKFNPNEQALYWKWKSDKKKKQSAVKEAEEWKARYELNTVKESAKDIKLRKISEALQSDNLTVEALQAIIGETAETKSKPLTEADLEKREAEKALKEKEVSESTKERAERIDTAEKIGKSKYENFEELTSLANELVASDKTGMYKDVLQASFLDKDLDESELVERVVTIAKLNPKYGKPKSDETEEKTDIDRAIKNSKKKISSASVGSGGGKRTISHDDLTPDEAAKLTTDEWRKLPEKVRKRLLMK